MADLNDVAADVKQLKQSVHQQGNILKLMMYSQATDFAASVVQALTSDQVLLEIYRRIDGIATKDALIKEVTGLDLPSGSRSRAYARFTQLENLGIVEAVTDAGRSGVFRRSAIADGLRIEQDPNYLRALKALKPIKVSK